MHKSKSAKSRDDSFFEPLQKPQLQEKSAGIKVVDAVPPKDAAELELEKVLFGDNAGFQQDLEEYNRELERVLSSDEEQAEPHEDGTISSDEEGMGGLDDAELFFLDTDAETFGRKSQQQIVLAEEKTVVEEGEQPAWVDSDDDRVAVSLATQTRLRKLRAFEGEDVISGREYTKRLQQQFERLHPIPDWAAQGNGAHRKKRRRTSISGSSSDESDDDAMSVDEDELSAQPLAKLLQSTDPLTASYSTSDARRKLKPEIIDVQRTKDVSDKQPSMITSLSFHPEHPILLSSGPSSLLTLHHISPSSPTPNPILTKLAIPGLHVNTSAIHAEGQNIYIGARRRYFHIWNMGTGKVARVTRIYGHQDEQRTYERFKLSPCGRYMALVGSSRKGGGVANIVDAKTGQWICQARVEGRGGVADLAWWRNGEGLVVLGKGGQAIEYSISERRVLARWADEGAVGTTVVALGGRLGNGADNGLGGDRWIAVGSQSGITNIYDRATWKADTLSSAPKPKRALGQLTTPTSNLEFSPDGQLLVMSSKGKSDALRLVHLPSCTVYRNWPTSGTPFGRVTAVAWGAGGSLLAVANEQGKIRLWEVRG